MKNKFIPHTYNSFNKLYFKKTRLVVHFNCFIIKLLLCKPTAGDKAFN